MICVNELCCKEFPARRSDQQACSPRCYRAIRAADLKLARIARGAIPRMRSAPLAERRDAHILIRLTPAEKEQFVAAAKARGVSLSTWGRTLMTADVLAVAGRTSAADTLARLCGHPIPDDAETVFTGDPDE